MLHKLKLDKIISLTQQYFLPLNIPLEWLHGCFISEYSLMTALLEYLNSSYKVQIAEKRQSVAGLQASPVSFRVFIVKCTELKLALIIVGCTVNSKLWKSQWRYDLYVLSWIYRSRLQIYYGYKKNPESC